MLQFQAMLQTSQGALETHCLALVGDSVAAHALRQMVALAASVDQPLLITGPDGSGKAAMAAAIHASGKHGSEHYVALRCSEIAGIIALDQLGAPAEWHMISPDGTLFLEDIDNLPLDAQTGLLAWLSDLPRTGGRLIAATSQKLVELVARGEFDAELYAQISSLIIPAQPLVRRRADVVSLIQAQWDSNPNGLRPILSKSAWSVLESHNWPGNLHELRNFALQSLDSFGGRRMDAAQVKQLLRHTSLHPQAVGATAPAVCDSLHLQTCLAIEERRLLAIALERSGGDIERAALMTGLTTAQFVSKLELHGLSVAVSS